jgi:hypothetical protein
MNDIEREAFLAALLTGDLSPDDPQVQARLSAEPELRAMHDRMREVEAEMAQAARDLSSLQVRGATPASEHADRVLMAVQQMVQERRRLQRRRWLVLAAATLLVGASLGWYFLVRTPTAPGNLVLDSSPGLAPHDQVAHYSPFTWNVDRPAGGRLVLRIYSSHDGKKGRLLFPAFEENVASPWQLPPELEARLPDEIYWELEVISAEGRDLLHAHAWRS